MNRDILEGLNEQQRLGVTTTEGPVLILAGAGSGKTRVLTHRIAYLMEEKGVAPYNIMAITFTNKAAGEMRRRVDELGGFGASAVWVMTFHATCVRILRRFIDRLGYDNNFSIYDVDDQKTAMKEVLHRLNIDPKRSKPKYFLNRISAAKNELLSPEEYAPHAMDPKTRQEIAVYREYQARLKSMDALDFDDLLMFTVKLFKRDPEVLDYYQNRFKYIMVDEYQDTNTAQFELVRLLAQGSGNLCVVGDDDQSIYRFRGANIMNILNFEKYFPNTMVIKLEQNYRSTQSILDAANGVIKNNEGRKVKRLWTENGSGDKPSYRQFDSAFEEADFVARDVKKQKHDGKFNYRESAVLYRTNAQSRLFEERFITLNIPYRIVGGVNFYARREIKDILAYLKIIDNHRDDISCRRIINVPKRGIGMTTVTRVADYAYLEDMSFYAALEQCEKIPGISRGKKNLKDFVTFIDSLKAKAGILSVPELINEILDKTGYRSALELEQTDEADTRLENLDELINKAIAFTRDNEEDKATLHAFLEEVALIADIDRLDDDEDYVLLMTLHSAKGLEFDNVYLVGMEDGLFPSFMSITSEDSFDEVEEERRLCYVGITRAKKRLNLTGAKMRMVRGENVYNAASRFVKEIPEGALKGEIHRIADRKKEELTPAVNTYSAKTFSKPAYRTGASGVSNFGTKIVKSTLDYGENDRVKHKKFGEGTVLSINDGGRDFEVKVDFDDHGIKKMFASFAKLQKI